VVAGADRGDRHRQQLRAFVVDPAQRFYGGAADSAALAWLERDTREITGEIERAAGRSLEVRVFVRR
jgi:hypothetical protein